MVKSIKKENSGIFKNYKPKTKVKKCKDCGKDFEQPGSARYERKYCSDCSKKRKDDGTIVGLMFIRARFEQLSEIIDFFEKNHHLLSQATICIVEKQMSINYTMVRISQHVETYFLTKYPNVAVFEISSKLKAAKEITKLF